MLLFAPGNSELLKSQHMSMNFEELQQGIQEIPLFGQRARKAASSQEQATLAPTLQLDGRTDSELEEEISIEQNLGFFWFIRNLGDPNFAFPFHSENSNTSCGFICFVNLKTWPLK